MKFDLIDALEQEYLTEAKKQRKLDWVNLEVYLFSLLYNDGTIEAINENAYASHIDSGEQAQKAYLKLVKVEDLLTNTVHNFDFPIAVYTAIMSNFSEGSYTTEVFEEAVKEVEKLCAKYNVKPLQYARFTSDDFELINPIDDEDD